MAGKCVAVGGKLEPGESPEECAIRETFEETGLKLSRLKLRGIISFIIDKQEQGLDTCLTCVFESESFDGEVTPSYEGELNWIEDADILKQNLLEKDRIFLPWIYEQEDFFSAKFYSLGTKLKSHEVHFY